MQVIVKDGAEHAKTTKPTAVPAARSPSLNRLVKPVADRDKMQLVFKNQRADRFSFRSKEKPSTGKPEQKPFKTLKGRGKDSFFLLAQDKQAPEIIRDSRRVFPATIRTQLESGTKIRKTTPLPNFPDFPVKIRSAKGRKIPTFHEAFGTDFDQVRPVIRPTSITTSTPRPRQPPPTPRRTTTATTTTTTTRTTHSHHRPHHPLDTLTAPDPDAPVANFFGTTLPHNHPLIHVLPPTSRVLGIQPLRKIPLSNRNRRKNHSRKTGKNAEIMTLGDFLKKFPSMEKMRKAAIIPVPVTDEKHIKMIELLAAQPTKVVPLVKDENNPDPHENDIDGMLKELEQLISNRAERKISFSKHHHHHHHNNKKKKSGGSSGPGLAVRPRGGLPGPRFSTVSGLGTKLTTPTPRFSTVSPTPTPRGSRHSPTPRSGSVSSPELEFGFRPITTQTVSASSTTTSFRITTPSPPVSPPISSPIRSGAKNPKAIWRTSTRRPPTPTPRLNPFWSQDAKTRQQIFTFDYDDETDTLVAPRFVLRFTLP